MKKVLIVEDDPWYQAQQYRVLSKFGFGPLLASDVYQAIEIIDSESPVAIILDLMLTYNTAFPLIYELQSSTLTSHIPIIIYSVKALRVNEQTIKSWGVIAVLDKTIMNPFDTAKILSRAGL